MAKGRIILTAAQREQRRRFHRRASLIGMALSVLALILMWADFPTAGVFALGIAAGIAVFLVFDEVLRG